MTIKTLAIIRELLAARVESLEAKRTEIQDELRSLTQNDEKECAIKSQEAYFQYACEVLDEAKDALSDFEKHDFR